MALLFSNTRALFNDCFTTLIINNSVLNLSKKSAGLDGLSPVIAGPLTKLFNHCIISSAWPKR